MPLTRLMGVFAVAFGMLAAQAPSEDPVMKARAQRAAAGDEDLPPVPRTVMEPPPLPAPETHVRDTRGYKASRHRSRKKGKAVTKKAPSSRSKASKAPATKKPSAAKKKKKK
ncbi:MAG: hypothetical protein LWX11_07040 [Firmicutes bacterium]|nr:hypothetical protein [Bacillota bacterium]